MKKPLYQPDAWIIYSKQTGSGFGKVVGGKCIDQVWVYYVNTGMSQTTVQVAEAKIIGVFEGVWKGPLGLTDADEKLED